MVKTKQGHTNFTFNIISFRFKATGSNCIKSHNIKFKHLQAQKESKNL